MLVNPLQVRAKTKLGTPPSYGQSLVKQKAIIMQSGIPSLQGREDVKRVLLQSAFILHRRPYRNTSLLLEAFSQEQGRLGLVARGVVAPKSRLKGLLQPFTPLLLSWTGVGELATLTTAEETALPIALPPNRGLAGLYVNELLVRLLPRLDPLPSLFVAYETLLAELATAPGEEPPLRRFEKRLLEELGYDRPIGAEYRPATSTDAGLQWLKDFREKTVSRLA